MEHLAGLTLVKKNEEEVSADEVLNDKEFVGFYFTEGIENCLEFEPLLAKCYEEARENNLSLEIIFVSSDKTEEEFYEHLNKCHADWLAIPFGSPAIKELEKQFDVGCIPHIAVTKKDGTLVSTGGVCCVKALGSLALPKWCYEGSGSFHFPDESEEDPDDSEEKGASEEFLLEHLSGLTLVNKNREEISADEVLNDKEFIGFYFAQGIENCLEFDPLLAKCYEEAKEKELSLEIILVSTETTEEEFYEHLNKCHADWFAVPFASPFIKKLEKRFDAGYIPHIAVIKKDGTLVSTGGICCMKESGFGWLALPKWCYEGSGSFCYPDKSECPESPEEEHIDITHFSMEHLAGQTLVRKNKEEVSADEALSDKEIVAFYFSAHWCPPCRMFTPVLADFYEEAKEGELPFEVIFVSSDKSKDDLFSYMEEAHGDWLAIPFGAPVIQEIKEKFDIQGIPMLIVVKKDGTVVSTNGRADVEKKGLGAYKEWSK